MVKQKTFPTNAFPSFSTVLLLFKPLLFDPPSRRRLHSVEAGGLAGWLLCCRGCSARLPRFLLLWFLPSRFVFFSILIVRVRMCKCKQKSFPFLSPFFLPRMNIQLLLPLLLLTLSRSVVVGARSTGFEGMEKTNRNYVLMLMAGFLLMVSFKLLPL